MPVDDMEMQMKHVWIIPHWVTCMSFDKLFPKGYHVAYTIFVFFICYLSADNVLETAFAVDNT